MSAYEDGSPEVEWVVDPRLGTFPAAIEAMRSYVLRMEPGMARDAPDGFIRRHFRSHARNLRTIKVVRLK